MRHDRLSRWMRAVRWRRLIDNEIIKVIYQFVIKHHFVRFPLESSASLRLQLPSALRSSANGARNAPSVSYACCVLVLVTSLAGCIVSIKGRPCRLPLFLSPSSIYRSWHCVDRVNVVEMSWLALKKSGLTSLAPDAKHWMSIVVVHTSIEIPHGSFRICKVWATLMEHRG
jgi:hypothetical protein